MKTNQRITDAIHDSEWRKDVIDRIIRSAAQGYSAVWLAAGSGFDSLISWEPAKGAAVAVVMSILFSLGATQVKNPTTNSFQQ